MILDVETTIGEMETSLTCIVQTADWDFAYLIGSSVTLNFTKSKNLKTSKHHSRLSFDYEFKIMDGSDMTEIKLTLRIKKVECGDQDDFVCGFVDNSTKIEKHAKLIVKRKLLHLKHLSIALHPITLYCFEFNHVRRCIESFLHFYYTANMSNNLFALA